MELKTTIISLIGSIIGAVIAVLIGYWSSKKILESTEKHTKQEKRKRICEQLKYLVDLYQNAF